MSIAVIVDAINESLQGIVIIRVGRDFDSLPVKKADAQLDGSCDHRLVKLKGVTDGRVLYGLLCQTCARRAGNRDDKPIFRDVLF